MLQMVVDFLTEIKLTDLLDQNVRLIEIWKLQSGAVFPEQIIFLSSFQK